MTTTSEKNDILASLRRTFVPIIAGVILSALLSLGIEIDPTALTTVVTGIFSGGYYALFRWLESKYPGASIFLGDRRKPTYQD